MNDRSQPTATALAASFEVVIGDARERYACSPEQSLLAGMERLGRKGIPVGCRGGGCGVCKVLIVSGQVHAAKMSAAHVSPRERDEGYVLACRAFPRSDLHIETAGALQRCLDRHRGSS
ncbi:MAG: 2Fe-2S iron-sulfur cluster-binding protein [Burkholderiaceae bacterium]